MFIVSLATADLTVGLVVMPIGAVYVFAVDWPFGLVVCQFWLAVDYTASTASILNLLVLSLDRYWSVTEPLRYLRRRTCRRAATLVSVAWSLSALWVLPIVGWHWVFTGGRRLVKAHVCDTEYAHNTALKIGTALVNYYVPLAVMAVLYGRIFVAIRRRARLEIWQNAAVVVGGGGSNGTGLSRRLLDRNEEDDAGEQADDDDADRCNNLHAVDRAAHAADHELDPSTMLTNVTATSNNDAEHQTASCAASACSRRLRPQYLALTDPVVVEVGIEERREGSAPAAQEDVDDVPPKHVRFVLNQTQTSKSMTCDGSPTAYDSNSNDLCTQCAKTFSCSRKIARRFRTAVRRQSNSNDTDPNNIELWPVEQGGGSVAGTETPRRPRSRRVSRRRRSRSSRRNSALSGDVKAAKQLGVIMGAFCVCFLPYFVCFVVVAACRSCVSDQLMTTVTWIGYVNSTLNPFLYALCNRQFRDSFRRMFESVRRRLGGRPVTATRRDVALAGLATGQRTCAAVHAREQFL